MAEKKAKTAHNKETKKKITHSCRDCGQEAQRVLFAGFGPRGFFWLCPEGHRAK